MASRKRKRQLPPWLQGVTIDKNGVPLDNVDDAGTERCPDITSTEMQIKDEISSCTKQHSTDKDQPLNGLENNMCTDKTAAKSSMVTITDTYNKYKKDRSLPLLEPEQKWTAEKAVEMSYRQFSFEGSIVYSHHVDDCNILCEEFISSINTDTDTVVGFDTEWPVTYEKGKQAKTALIQVCASTDKCYLFHVSCMSKFPVMLKTLLEMHNVKKVGMNVENDIWKLDLDFDIKARDVIKNSTIELRTLANKKLRSAENWSLEGLAKNVLQVRISKDPNIRKCDWSQYPLPESQQRYAATDAIISLMIYTHLMKK